MQCDFRWLPNLQVTRHQLGQESCWPRGWPPHIMLWARRSAPSSQGLHRDWHHLPAEKKPLYRNCGLWGVERPASRQIHEIREGSGRAAEGRCSQERSKCLPSPTVPQNHGGTKAHNTMSKCFKIQTWWVLNSPMGSCLSTTSTVQNQAMLQ